MGKHSAGILLYRKRASGIEVLLVHPGGPYWVNQDEAAWSIPKGEVGENEDPAAAADREFAEETGTSPVGLKIQLMPVRQPGGKLIHAWAMEGNLDPQTIKSNTFQIEWPPQSGQLHELPEIDRAAWFTIETAIKKIHKGQRPLLLQLRSIVG